MWEKAPDKFYFCVKKWISELIYIGSLTGRPSKFWQILHREATILLNFFYH